jgi:hypothetical protein
MDIERDVDVLIVACLPPRLLERRLRLGQYQRTQDGLEKFCNGCQEYWPADSEFFYANRNHADGLGNSCKACYLEKRYPNGRSTASPVLLQPTKGESHDAI